MKEVRKIIQIDEDLCDGCGNCITGCAEAALQIIDGKARLVADKYCDGLGACLGECPTGALKLIERKADAFDEEAVEELIAKQKQEAGAPGPAPGGCPSAGMMTMTPCQSANAPTSQAAQAQGSALSHWPIQLRLVPPTAPFLKGAKLLLAADCVPASMPGYHSQWLPGRIVLLGCPKFDDAQSYVAKLRDIFAQNDIEDVTVLEMEVPCCSGMHQIAARALAESGRDVDIERVIVSRRGEVIGQEKVGKPQIAAL